MRLLLPLLLLIFAACRGTLDSGKGYAGSKAAPPAPSEKDGESPEERDDDFPAVEHELACEGPDYILFITKPDDKGITKARVRLNDAISAVEIPVFVGLGVEPGAKQYTADGFILRIKLVNGARRGTLSAVIEGRAFDDEVECTLPANDD